jgi:predicted nucleic acid-binding protein
MPRDLRRPREFEGVDQRANQAEFAPANGRPRSGLDTIIAAVAEANGCIVVTINEKDFEGVEVFNPLR